MTDVTDEGNNMIITVYFSDDEDEEDQYCYPPEDNPELDELLNQILAS